MILLIRIDLLPDVPVLSVKIRDQRSQTNQQGDLWIASSTLCQDPGPTFPDQSARRSLDCFRRKRIQLPSRMLGVKEDPRTTLTNESQVKSLGHFFLIGGRSIPTKNTVSPSMWILSG